MRDVVYTPENPPATCGTIELKPKDKTCATAALYLDRAEARELFFQLGDQLGYTWTHHSQKKKPEPAGPEPTPQQRQDIAATATLHNLGYRWHGSEQWWQPPKAAEPTEEEREVLASQRWQMACNAAMAAKEPAHWHQARLEAQLSTARQEGQRWHNELQRIGSALKLDAGADTTRDIIPEIERLRTRVSTQHQQLQTQDQQLQSWMDSSTRMAGAFGALRNALGITDMRDRIEMGVLEAVQELQRKSKNTQESADWADAELNRIGGAVGITEHGQCSANFIVPAIVALKTKAAEAESLRSYNAELQKALNGVQAALRDHGYEPGPAQQSLSVLIRDAFGAEAAKLRQAQAVNRVTIPTDTMEQTFQHHWKRGWTTGAGEERDRIIGRLEAEKARILKCHQEMLRGLEGADLATNCRMELSRLDAWINAIKVTAPQ